MLALDELSGLGYVGAMDISSSHSPLTSTCSILSHTPIAAVSKIFTNHPVRPQ